MGIAAFLGIVIVALILGIAVQLVFRSAHRWEWLGVAVAAAFGAYFASETFVTDKGASATSVFSGIKDWGPSYDGLFIVPAIIVGLILAIVADIGIRSMPTSAAHA